VASAVVLAFGNSVFAPFVLDDHVSILDNRSLQRLWPLGSALFAERESPLAGRPFVNLSFAINYALDGLHPRLYHAGNVVLHAVCALLLWAVILQTCRLPRVRPLVSRAGWMATACALLWAVHPLNSEAVDYVTQRTELMMAAAFLLTLYLSIRAWDAVHPWRWQAAAVVACAAGMTCKESMVTAPLVVVLFDAAYRTDSVVDAVRQRWRFYLALAATWIVLGWLMSAGPRMHSTGFFTGVSSWTYLLNQSGIIAHYLRLAVWPSGLVADYGAPGLVSLREVWLPTLLVGGAAVAAVVLFVRRAPLGFLALFVFIALAPTSSIVPIATEVGAERRMYLPLIGIVVGGVLLIEMLGRRVAPVLTRFAPASRHGLAATTLVVMLASVYTLLSVERGREYGSEVVLTTGIVERRPSGHSHALLAQALNDAGRPAEALAHLRQAVDGEPRAHYMLAVALYNDRQFDDARREFETFIRLEPDLAEVVDAHDALGALASRAGQPGLAEDHTRAALAMNPAHPAARKHLGDALLAQHRFDEAIREYRQYLRLKPADDEAITNVGVALGNLGSENADAEAEFRRALALNPSNQKANRTLAVLLLQRGNAGEAEPFARRAVQLAANDALSHDLLGMVLDSRASSAAALSEFQQAVRLDPGDPSFREHYQLTLEKLRGNPPRAR
jgi:Flp pilus assembly protein TadD